MYAAWARWAALEIDGRLAYADGDYQRAEASGRLVFDLAMKFEERRAFAVLRTQRALALARLGRLPEARALVTLALDEQRAKIAAGSDDQMLRLELAQSLYALAWTQPDGGAKELKEAADLLDALPVAMQPYRTVRLWRERIAQGTRIARVPAVGTAVVTATK